MFGWRKNADVDDNRRTATDKERDEWRSNDDDNGDAVLGEWRNPRMHDEDSRMEMMMIDLILILQLTAKELEVIAFKPEICHDVMCLRWRAEGGEATYRPRS
jgi:hypothetical protein